MKADVCVIGAGIIGVTTALELRERGCDVLLVDRGEVGQATSFGNAGVLSVSTVLNVNNPGLLKSLPILLLGRSPALRYDPGFALRRVSWVLAFLKRAARRYVASTAHTLHALQKISLQRHRELLQQAQASELLRENGWLKVYRDAAGFRASALERELMQELDIPFDTLSREDIRGLEPGLVAGYEHGILLKETCSVESPLALTQAYFRLFLERGGKFRTLDVRGIEKGERHGWKLSGEHGDTIPASDIVVAAGPWSPELCRRLGQVIPMAWERGYHLNVASGAIPLRRPILDVQGGFVMAPQGETTRISSGVEFAHRDAPPDDRQIRRAVAEARRCVEFGESQDETPWLGSRPTLPDSLPMIGSVGGKRGLWVNVGHQHIGLSTSTGSALVLADLIERGATAELDASVFSPARFGSRKRF